MRRLWFTGSLLVLVASASVSFAEVSVRVDRSGQYVTTQIDMAKPGSRTLDGPWGSRGIAKRGTQVLNPHGDLNGDLWPVIVDSNVAPFYPWAVWSRFDTSGYQLAWSVWDGTQWKEIEAVHARTLGDDLDPDIAFGPQGHPAVVWSRSEGGIDKIYFSRFLKKGFTAPIVISDPTRSGRYPQIVSHDGDSVLVEWEGPEGTVERTVTFSLPVTITDDINPVERNPGTTPVFTGTQNAPEESFGRRERPTR